MGNCQRLNGAAALRCWACLVFSVLLLPAGCVMEPPVPQKTQLEMRQIQTRSYDNPQGGAARIMKAVINVLQDDGFIIRNADKDLGFITAAKERDVEDQWESFFSVLAADGQQARYRKNSVVECSVNISEFGREIKVRAIFQAKVLDNLGGVISVKQVDDASFYQTFFSKVDKGIFLEKQDL